ncbi:acetylglutamate kinase [Urechidicola vernalis]|uniref:Acetylglutamate kinase n=1 Tax=Urechidicola vernalis TaxID=3075600 RepID=A0ABU2Y5F6_9FLAO|nr:acetylglutamate kinase [Urechidicola sp. P050]MDT0552884.1 acetylglutamate kinase [Urechidicola sp. P050]
MGKQKLHIVKIGGNIINDKNTLSAFIKDFAQLDGKKILVHGGGKRATELANSIGLEPKMVNGRRITDEANLEIVTMVYAGLLNKTIVAELHQNNCNALGLSGADVNTIQAHKRMVKDIDYGFAGDIDAVNHKAIDVFLQNDMTPVFCAISHDKKGQLLNTNADTIVSEVAIAMSKDYDTSLIYTFEKNGVLRTIEDDNSVIEHINSKYYEQLKEEGIIADGMLPKMLNCFNALQRGVSEVKIANPTILKNQNQLHTTLVL